MAAAGRPSAWSAAARLAVTVDLPTPPLPEPTQTMFLTAARAPSGSPPCRPSRCWSPCFSSWLRTSKPTPTRSTPSSSPTHWTTACWKCERIGHPGVVRETTTSTLPGSGCSIERTIPSETMSLRSSGSMTRRRTSLICSWVGIGHDCGKGGPSAGAEIDRGAPEQALGLADPAAQGAVGEPVARPVGGLAGKQDPARHRLGERVHVGGRAAHQHGRVGTAAERVALPVGDRKGPGSRHAASEDLAQAGEGELQRLVRAEAMQVAGEATTAEGHEGGVAAGPVQVEEEGEL